MAWLLFLSALPGAVVGAGLESVINEHLGQIWLIAVMLIVFGLVLLVADRLPGTLKEGDYGPRQALGMGLAQAAALSPGVSRSGITITAGRFLGFDRNAAARLSFLMSMPITGGAALYKGAELAANGLPPGTAPAFFWGIVASGDHRIGSGMAGADGGADPLVPPVRGVPGGCGAGRARAAGVTSAVRTSVTTPAATA